MLDQQTVERLAQRLDDAERSKSLITAFTREYPDLTIEDAYAIQRAWTKLQLSRGRIVRGHKIGLTSKAMQNAVGISEPDYGVLFADMFYPDASPIPFDRFHAPRIEVELAFVLKTPLKGPDCTLFDVLNATDYVTPALEILETRMHRVDPETKAPRKVMDTISDNAANAALVVGGRLQRGPANGHLVAVCHRCRSGQHQLDLPRLPAHLHQRPRPLQTPLLCCRDVDEWVARL